MVSAPWHLPQHIVCGVTFVSFFYLKTGLFANHFLCIFSASIALVFGIIYRAGAMSFKYFGNPLLKRHSSSTETEKS